MNAVIHLSTDIRFLADRIKKEIYRDHFLMRDVMDLGLGMFGYRSPNFKGGCGDTKGTFHEVLFGILFPYLKSQIAFGTGKGGYKKYGVKRYIADFYDEEHKTIYEIDGKSHRTKLGILSDVLRDRFFRNELGIKTIRISNEGVEKLLEDRLSLLQEEGGLKDVA
ncbi:DUF559 domain-containing protein [Bacillus cereus]|nr:MULTISPECIES: DUF559 domain-containing protein [Bacillus cereus group]MEB8731408.1 DUF559 domain-containing protein [Bacillus cereus]EJR65653.1 hypothetical protein IK5_05381 [Bacillus cereus VD154]MEB8750597.1 DUF559 domain-containing protein [Bacillus cereus]MEB8759016.1 DUF559 domain-containing protein [Bacillus cereus]MEB8895576.1 DUF559 domain-containing protein [Bacillus cereus]